MNKVMLIGNLTKDPELKQTQGGKAMAIFTLAVKRQFSKEGQSDTDFINCDCFGVVAEALCNYQKKGSKIAVVGRLRTGSYTNKEGKKVYTWGVTADEVEWLDKKGSKDGGTRDDMYRDNDFTPFDGNDDIPF